MKIIKKLLPLLGLLYFGASILGAQRGVPYESTTTNVTIIAHQGFHSITNHAATASLIAGYDANKKLVSFTAAATRSLLSVPVFQLTDPGSENLFPMWDDSDNRIEFVSAATFLAAIGGSGGGGGSQTPWAQNIDGGGYDLSNVGTIEADAITTTEIITDLIEAGEIILDEPISASIGGTGKTNWTEGSVALFNGTNAAVEVLVQDSVTDGSTNIPTQNAVYDYVQTQIAGVSGGVDVTSVTLFDDLFYYVYSSFTSAGQGGFAFTKLASAAGTAVAGATGTQDAPGIANISCGTTTTGAASLFNPNATLIRLGAGAYTLKFRFRLNHLPSTSGEEFNLYLGFLDSTTGDGTDSVHIQATSGNPNFVAVCQNNGTSTTSDFETAYATGTWYTATITVNSDASSVAFDLNGDTETIATNIPSGSGRETSLAFTIDKDAGSTPATFDMDYVLMSYGVTR